MKYPAAFLAAESTAIASGLILLGGGEHSTNFSIQPGERDQLHTETLGDLNNRRQDALHLNLFALT